MPKSKIHNNLRGTGISVSDLKDVHDTSVLTPGATKTKAENEKNSVDQYETGSGKSPGKWGGENAGV